MKGIKSGRHPAVVALVSALVVLTGWFLIKRFPIEISITSAQPNPVPVIKTDATPANDTAKPPVESDATPKLAKPDPAAKQGSLRIRNRSDHSLRVALLSRQPKEASAKSGTIPSGFALPAHWDFAPNEGSSSGLLVSLPNQAIQLKRGDVVVAFAQDGSQRYWGPFVVGETDRPSWNTQTAEWDLILDN